MGNLPDVVYSLTSASSLLILRLLLTRSPSHIEFHITLEYEIGYLIDACSTNNTVCILEDRTNVDYTGLRSFKGQACDS